MRWHSRVKPGFDPIGKPRRSTHILVPRQPGDSIAVPPPYGDSGRVGLSEQQVANGAGVAHARANSRPMLSACEVAPPITNSFTFALAKKR